MEHRQDSWMGFLSPGGQSNRPPRALSDFRDEKATPSATIFGGVAFSSGRGNVGTGLSIRTTAFRRRWLEQGTGPPQAEHRAGFLVAVVTFAMVAR
jgi:hypothetical protein